MVRASLSVNPATILGDLQPPKTPVAGLYNMSICSALLHVSQRIVQGTFSWGQEYCSDGLLSPNLPLGPYNNTGSEITAEGTLAIAKHFSHMVT